MNTATSHLRLALPLFFGGTWFQAVTLIVFGFIVSVSVWDGNDTWMYAIVFGLISIGTIVGYRPEAARYRVLNLSSGLYQRHFRIGLTALMFVIAVFFAVILMRTDYARWWVIAGVVLVLYSVQMMTETNLSQPGTLADRVREGSPPASTDVRGEELIVDDLERELIVRPQRKFWVEAWFAVAGVAAVWLLMVWFWGHPLAESSAIPAMISVAVLATVATGVFRDNFSQWVAFGGSRMRWAKKTRWVILLNPLAGGAVAAALVFFGVVETVEGMLGLLAAALLAPVLMVLLQLATKATAVYLLVSFALTVAGVAAFIAGYELVLFVVAVVCFIGFEILLPRIVRAYSPFSGGVWVWLGMRESAV
ncbi:MAG TPA: hypothetical protein VFC72_06240 [Corynebacterium sp.]|nr:hypothetical protein [Corynebacterium sp.]